MNYTGHTEGSVIKSIFRMGLPTMIGFGAANIYDIIDMFWLARLGVKEPAAVTFFFSFLWVLSSVNMIAGTGSVSVISQSFGSGDRGLTEASIKETFLLKALLAIGFGAVGLLLCEPVLKLLGAKGEVLSMAMDYGTVQLIGMIFPFCAFTVYTSLRGIGNPKWAMALMLASIGLNVILDPVLIFGWWIFPRLGVAGAAWASIIGYAFSVVMGLALLYGGALNLRLHVRSGVEIAWKNMLKIMRIGLPSGIGSISFSLSRSVIMGLVAVYGTEIVAAYGIGNRISAFGIMIVVGLGLGISALIGQVLGAEKEDRAIETARQSILLSTVVMTVFGAMCFLGADYLMRAFFETSGGGQPARVHEAGVILMKVFAFSFPFTGLFITIEQIFCGAGKNTPGMVLSIIGNWVIEIPLILLLADTVGLKELGVWFGITISSAISASAFYWYYTRRTWLSHRVKNPGVSEA